MAGSPTPPERDTGGIVSPEDLRTAIRRVLADYEAFVSRTPIEGVHEDPKAFAAHHAAAKTALAHLEHLLKLARSAAAGQAASGDCPDALLTQARAAIAADCTEEDEPDDDTG
ncbi:hypothetical protein LPC08_18390 [Roseomonas sp. OT10]|uniref:hypothetical protein n=1 Tax=Roseomonas cutis TaxID=2897332 RepID=UPI001E3AEE70|nr:hypothetical protein [Roseomonas sp. OT10]UFN47965.1 hypothetical protein LPC08_18390 [Roseomonas sp. OT10]